jgi:hypothetical protein
MIMLDETLDRELEEIDTAEDVWEQLLFIHTKLEMTYGHQGLEVETFGNAIRKKLSLRRNSVILSTLARQRASMLKEGAANDIIQAELQKKEGLMKKQMATKKFKPSIENHQALQELISHMAEAGLDAGDLVAILEKLYGPTVKN